MCGFCERAYDVHTIQDRTRYGASSNDRSDTFVPLFPRQPVVVHAAVLNRNEHRQCEPADLGAQHVTISGLIEIAAGAILLSMIPARLGIYGYIPPLIVIIVGHALFQTANNTAVMEDIRPGQRGVVSGRLNLSRTLGLITGASVMGAVFAAASSTADITTAPPDAVANGMQITFALAAILVLVALIIALARYRRKLYGWVTAPTAGS